MDIDDGRATRICVVPPGDGLAQWSPDGETIIFGPNLPPRDLFEVPASGGEPSVLLTNEKITEGVGAPLGSTVAPIAFAQRPGGGMALFVHAFNFAATMTGVVDLTSGTVHMLSDGGRARYSSGHYLYAAGRFENEIFAVPYSLETLSPVGARFVAVDGGNGYSVSSEGALVYSDPTTRPYPLHYSWRDREGKRVGAPWGEAPELNYAELSPDGENVAFEADDEEGVNDLWVENIARGVRTRLTSDSERESHPIWSPDGEYLAYASGRTSGRDIVLRRADGDGDPQVIWEGGAPTDWSPDGRRILSTTVDDGQFDRQFNLNYLQRQEDGSWAPVDFLKSPSTERAGRFSPSGRHVAYTSDESGTFEIYIRRFPEGDRKVTVSKGGGEAPQWSKDGKELFFVKGRTLMAVPVKVDGDEVTVGVPKPLFEHGRLKMPSSVARYGVAADGRFLVVDEGEGPEVELPPARFHVVLNWAEEFRDRQ